MVGAVIDAAEGEIGVTLGERVTVEQQRLLAAIARCAAEERVLTPLAKAPVIGEGAVRRRDGGIILLDPPAHLRTQGLAQGDQRRRHAVGMGVLRFEMRADRGRQSGWVVKHFAPVLGTQPGVKRRGARRRAHGSQSPAAPRREAWLLPV